MQKSTHAADTIRNLGVHFDSCMTMTTHVSQRVRCCFYQLHRIKTIRRFIPTSTAVILVKSFIVSRVDYYNSILAGLPTCQLQRIQSVRPVLKNTGALEHSVMYRLSVPSLLFLPSL